MSGPLKSLADPMSPYNTSMRYFKAEREKKATERRERVNKECEKALSTSSESEPEDKEKQLTPKQIEYRRDIDRMCDELARNRRERHEKRMKEIEQSFSCTIL